MNRTLMRGLLAFPQMTETNNEQAKLKETSITG